MEIDRLLEAALAEVGLPLYFAEKSGECIVSTYYARPGSSADDWEDTMVYRILLNVYVRKGIKKTAMKVVKALKKAGFVGVSFEQPVKEETGEWNIAISAQKAVEEREE